MKRKKGPKKLYFTVIILVIFILLIGHLLILFSKDSRQASKMDKKIAEVQSEIDQLREKNIKLRKQSELLQNGSFVEKIAREQLGMVKKDEVALIEIKNHSNKGIKQEEDVKPVEKTPGTLELCKKNVEEFLNTIFRTISIKGSE